MKLRALTADDVGEIAVLANDWDIARRMTRLPYPYAIEDARFYIQEIVPHELAWGIASGAGGALLGIAGMVPHTTEKIAELGYWLGRPHWGKGIATEAARAIVEYGFGTLGLAALTSGCFVDNVPSWRVLTKLGFAETGRSHCACLAEGRDLPFVAMRLEAANWPSV